MTLSFALALTMTSRNPPSTIHPTTTTRAERAPTETKLSANLANETERRDVRCNISGLDARACPVPTLEGDDGGSL